MVVISHTLFLLLIFYRNIDESSLLIDDESSNITDSLHTAEESEVNDDIDIESCGDDESAQKCFFCAKKKY